MAAYDALTEVKRGDEAKRVLENPIYKEAIQNVREGLIHSMVRSGLGDATTHNRLVIGLQLLAQIENQLQSVMETGKMAQIQLEEPSIIKRMFG